MTPTGRRRAEEPTERDGRSEHRAASSEALGPGVPLDPATKHTMERGFGHDFSAVRIHADDRAGAAARSVQAVAFTRGEDVVVTPEAYRPETDAGQRLVAHELAHVLQQSGRPPRGARPDPSGDREADAAAQAVVSGQQARIPPRAVTGIQRTPGPVAAPVQPALTPEEMWTRLVQDKRGFESSSSGAGDAYRSKPATAPKGGLAVDESGNPTAKGAPLGKGYETFAGLQLVDKNGNRVALAADGFRTGGPDDHAEARSIRALERSGPARLDGGRLMVVSDQTICPSCRARLIAYARSRGLRVVEPYEPERNRMVGKGTASPKTTSRSSTQAGRPAVRIVAQKQIVISAPTPPPAKPARTPPRAKAATTTAPKSTLPKTTLPKTTAPRTAPTIPAPAGPHVKTPAAPTMKPPTAPRSRVRPGGGTGGGGRMGVGGAAAGAGAAIVGMFLQLYMQRKVQEVLDEKNAAAFERDLHAQEKRIDELMAAQQATARKLQESGANVYVNLTLLVRYQQDVSGELGGGTAYMGLAVHDLKVSTTLIPTVTTAFASTGFGAYVLESSFGSIERHISFSMTYPDLQLASRPDAASQAPADGCFIATACYGTPDAPAVVVLRAFREHALRPHRAGRLAIAAYARLSPPVADVLRRHATARTLVRRLVVVPLATAAACYLRRDPPALPDDGVHRPV